MSNIHPAARRHNEMILTCCLRAFNLMFGLKYMCFVNDMNSMYLHVPVRHTLIIAQLTAKAVSF